MVENNEVIIDNWVMRLHRPEGIGPFPVLIMLHGWTGDEQSMWVFTPRLPKDMLLIAPRGVFSARKGGYSWHPELQKPWPSMADFQPAVEKLLITINDRNFPEGDFSRLYLIGFSQGTAFSYSLAIFYPERITAVAGLSGFIPEETSAWMHEKRLEGLPFFIAHGTNDDRVPIEKARQSVELLGKAGALVTYCEDDVGHKLSAKCFHGLEAFFQRENC